MDCIAEGKMLRQMKFELDFHRKNLFIKQWYYYIYHSQLLLTQRKQRRKAETHKTVPCQAWKDTGRCNYGKRCKFAHGPEELRPIMKTPVKIFNNPRYRTALCIKYTTFGFCPYGDQCHFIHNPEPIDLEKCLDRLSKSSTSPQLSPKLVDDLPNNVSSSTETNSETTQFSLWKQSEQLELLSDTESMSKSESGRNSEAKLSPQADLKKDTQDKDGQAAPYDPFRGSEIGKVEIEFKPVFFNAFDDFYNVINSSRVLPKKQ